MRKAPTDCDSTLGGVRRSALERSYVSLGSRRTSSVHEFYRYPARFSPTFARSVIDAFSRPGQIVLDPFVGGGTTIVEARLAGRVSIGADLNELATFVSQAKTSVQDAASLANARKWLSDVPFVLTTDSGSLPDEPWRGRGYTKHLDSRDTWRIRNLLAQALASLGRIDNPKAELLVRCAILRTGQWALDMRDEIPGVALFREKLTASLSGMIDVAEEYARTVRAVDRANPSGGLLRTLILNDRVPGLSSNRALRAHPAPSLICTSPPYPGVYVNYHRWKVLGRKETPAPYWVAGCLDGHGMAHYTMSAKVSRTNLDAYFEQATNAWTDLASLADDRTWVVQMVGFHEAQRDLPPYLNAMRSAGFEEVKFDETATDSDGRLWRDVPGRRWWVTAKAQAGTAAHTAREVVLFHRLTA